ncbi:hypothetical protein HAX54_050072 [Datura stramonium]|uniref:Uncharacterized protein n=1 Tax=Datura stramonium TaxID=4076 RepID=A0ABS8RRJ3_DATST|nr:hypothetical protein [Datura stramonium]
MPVRPAAQCTSTPAQPEARGACLSTLLAVRHDTISSDTACAMQQEFGTVPGAGLPRDSLRDAALVLRDALRGTPRFFKRPAVKSYFNQENEIQIPNQIRKGKKKAKIYYKYPLFLCKVKPSFREVLTSLDTI